MQKSNSLKLFHKKALWKLFRKIQLLVRLNLYSSSEGIFLIFTHGKALEPLKNVLRICDSCKKTKTIIKTISILHNSMTLPFLQSTVIRIDKRFKPEFLKNFQIYPPKQHYQKARFWKISTTKLPTWYMDSAVKMVFYRRCKASSIVLWNRILGQLKLRINIYGTRLKFMTFELTVVFMNTRDNLNNSWNFSLNATLSPI